MGEKVEINIRTWGEKIHSPFAERRILNLRYNLPLKRLLQLQPLFAYNAFILQPRRYLSFDEYISSFCRSCRREEGLLVRCLRHESVLQIPFQLSNHEYRYSIVIEPPSSFHAEGEVGASKWRFKLKIEGSQAEAIIQRPSGLQFTYMGEGVTPLLIPEDMDFVKFEPLLLKEPRSVYYVFDRFFRHIARLMDPFLFFVPRYNLHIITPHDEFTIPAHRTSLDS